MDPSEKGKKRDDVGGEATARQQEIGPSGGPPDDRERQRRGATPTEDVMDEKLREGAPRSRPEGTGDQGELGEPDAGVGDAPDLE
jgi:hypothetical protein